MLLEMKNELPQTKSVPRSSSVIDCTKKAVNCLAGNSNNANHAFLANNLHQTGKYYLAFEKAI